MSASPFAPPPDRLVDAGHQQLGRFAGPVRANLVDAPYRGLPRFLRRWRLKEWQALQKDLQFNYEESAPAEIVIQSPSRVYATPTPVPGNVYYF